jgi:ribonuclease D
MLFLTKLSFFLHENPVDLDPPIHYIQTQTTLEGACATLSQQSWITLDTEFIREKTYWPEPALFQVSGKGLGVYLIDPLADLDLTPFWDLLKNEAVIKVLHSGRQDVEIFWKMSKTLPHPLFDTQVAAMVVGLGEQLSYEFLVGHFTGHPLDKTSRLSNWKQRPLTPLQIRYAAMDVTHLRTVYEALSTTIKTLGREDWMQDDIKILQDPATYDIEPERAWERFRGKTNLIHKGSAFGVLKTLTQWREEYAQTYDISRSILFKDEFLYEILKSIPTTLNSIKKIKGLSSDSFDYYGKIILSLILEGLEDNTPFPTPTPWHEILTPQQIQMLDHLKLFFASQTAALKVPMKTLLGHPEAIERLVSGNPSSPLLHGWRKVAFGDKILALIQGKAGLQFMDGFSHIRLLS